MDKAVAEVIVEFGNEQFNPPAGIAEYTLHSRELDGSLDYYVVEICTEKVRGKERTWKTEYNSLSEFIIEVGPCFYIE